ncbi:hypothetical protein D3C81_1322400 [compost metagenome]
MPTHASNERQYLVVISRKETRGALPTASWSSFSMRSSCSVKAGVSSAAWRRYRPIKPSGAARKNGTRQPHSRKRASPRMLLSTTTTPAPSTKPAMEPKSSQLLRKPRLRSGANSATKTAAPVYSPPTEKPCTSLHSSNRIGARMPMLSYDGIKPMQNVLIAIRMMVADNTFCLPNLSPITPKNTPPNGRTRNGTENVPSAAMVCTLGDASGKNTLPRA